MPIYRSAVESSAKSCWNLIQKACRKQPDGPTFGRLHWNVRACVYYSAEGSHSCADTSSAYCFYIKCAFGRLWKQTRSHRTKVDILWDAICWQDVCVYVCVCSRVFWYAVVIKIIRWTGICTTIWKCFTSLCQINRFDVKAHLHDCRIYMSTVDSETKYSLQHGFIVLSAFSQLLLSLLGMKPVMFHFRESTVNGVYHWRLQESAVASVAVTGINPTDMWTYLKGCVHSVPINEQMTPTPFMAYKLVLVE